MLGCKICYTSISHLYLYPVFQYHITCIPKTLRFLIRKYVRKKKNTVILSSKVRLMPWLSLIAQVFCNTRNTNVCIQRLMT